MQRMSTRLHGVIDYLWVALVLILPRVMGSSTGTKRLLNVSAVLTAVVGLLTRYEWGALKLLTMSSHLRMDTFQAVTLAAAQSTILRRRRRDRSLLLTLSIIALAVVLISRTEPAVAQTRRPTDRLRSRIAADFARDERGTAGR